MDGSGPDESRTSYSRRTPVPETALAACALLVAAAYATWQLAIGGSDAAQTAASNFATPTLSVAATIMAWRAACHYRRNTALATPWRRLALAVSFMALGDVSWAVGESIFGVEPEAGWHDVPFLASYPMLLVALLSFPPVFSNRTERAKFWLDSLIVLVGGSMLVWYFILYPTASRPGTDPLARAVAFAYIVGDLVLLLGVAAVLLRRPPAAVRRALALIVVGLLLQLAGDLALAHGSLSEEYVTGGVTDALWVLSYAFLVLAGYVQIRTRRRGDEPDGEGLRRYRALPYAAIAAGYGLLLVVGGQQDSPAVAGLIFCAVLLTGLVVARQVIGMNENSRLAQEVAARRSEARFRSLVQNSSDVLTILDRAGRISWQSPSADRVLGPAAPASGRRLADVAHPEDVRAVDELVGAALLAGAGGPTEWRAHRGGDDWLFLESTASNLVDDPTVGGVVVNTRDITERKELELKLGQAAKLEAVGRLAGGVAHDFNNLLTAIQGHTSLLLEEHEREPGLREELEEIDRASRRAASLTRQLLAFSRRQVLQPRIIDANEAVSGMQRMLRRLVRENIDIVVRLDEAAGPILMDPTQFEQILLNLCVNAGDAMPAGGTLTVSTSAADSDFLLTVEDTGIGMDPGTLTHIFEPFFTTKAPGEGTGLGLATVYGIVQQSGGTIEVQSEPGTGTTFVIRLPAAHGRAERPVAVEAVVPQPGTETVLLVEDEAAVRGLARRTLERHGYSVLEAHDGEAALERARAHSGTIDLLLTDVIMPRLGGPQLAARLRGDRPDVRVLFMSGYTDDVAIVEGAMTGGSAFLQKPFTPRELAARVRLILDAPR